MKKFSRVPLVLGSFDAGYSIRERDLSELEINGALIAAVSRAGRGVRRGHGALRSQGARTRSLHNGVRGLAVSNVGLRDR